MMDFRWYRNISLQLRTSLLAVALASFIPVCVFSAIVIHLFTQQHREHTHEQLVGLAQAVSIAIDHELFHQIDALERIALSDLLERADLSDFHASFSMTQARMGWLALALHDHTGQQLLNTTAPFGAALAATMHKTSLRETVQSARPQIVGIQPPGTITPEPFILLRVPVVRNDTVTLVLSAAVPTKHLNELLTQQRLPANATAAALDSQMNIAARNRAQAEFIGTRATPSLVDKITTAEEGLFAALNKEGQPVYTVFRKSPDTGWVVAIAIPATVIEGPMQQTMLFLIVTGMVLAASGMCLVIFISRTIARRHRAETDLEAAQAAFAEREREALILAKEAAERESEEKGKSLKAAEAQLQQAQKLEAVGQLTGGVAHDFNNLLQVILGTTELLLDQFSEHQKVRALVEMTRTAAERGAELVARLLAFARRQSLDPKATDINVLLSNMSDLLRRTIGEHIEVEIVHRDGLWKALIDQAQLESAVLNLCINARDAMPGGGKLTVELTNDVLDQDDVDKNADVSPGEYVMIVVSDNGTGMQPEVVSRAFEPFFTTKQVGEGSGLGLSMVYGFIKQSRGHVQIYSEPGRGTAVKLYLPKLNENGDMSYQQRATGDIPRGNERVLVVEDDDSVRAHAAAQLESLGYNVVVARNGPEALEKIKKAASFDLLFTDVVMPGGMNGRQLADEARRLRPDLPVLFTSGYSENTIEHHGRLDTGVQFIQKPYRRQNLAAKLRQILDVDDRS